MKNQVTGAQSISDLSNNQKWLSKKKLSQNRYILKMEDLSHGFLWVLVIHCFSFVDCKHNIDDQDILIPSVSSYDLGTSPSKQHGLGVNLKELSNWTNSFASLASRDEALAKELESEVKNLNRTSNENVVEAYFKFLSRPMQTHCKVGKWMAHNR